MDLKSQVWARAEELEEALWALATRIHDHPELGFEEHKACAWLSEALEKGGFTVERGVGTLPTAFRAVHPSSSGDGPTIALLCEYDALPGIGHACGHNLIATMSVGAGLALAAFKSQLPGRLMVMGTPAEEAGGGKVILIREGLFKDVDAAMLVHPSCWTVMTRDSLAIRTVNIEFRGKAAHASSRPEEGVNALDAVMQTFQGINALRQHLRDGSRIHGVVTHGGERPNIVPEHASCQFYVRYKEDAYCDELVLKLKRCAEGAALATGATFSFPPGGHQYKTRRDNQVMANTFRRHLESLGWQIKPYTGGSGSSDMGDVSWEVPAIQTYLQISDESVPTHSPQFAVAARSDRARKVMMDGIKTLAATCLDLWNDPALFRQVREEFAQIR